MRMFRRIFLIILWVAGVLGVAIFPAYGATFDVTNCNDSGAGSLRQAVLDANGAGGADDITFSVVCTITLTSGEIDITDSVNIIGNGSTISGNNANRIFYVTGFISVTIDNLIFTNGSSGDGGAIYNDGANLTINNSTFTNNTASLFAGAVANEATLTINNSAFTNNTASMSGGAVASAGTSTISDSIFNSNTVTNGYGGAVANEATLTINNSAFTNNTASMSGGAVASTGTSTISDSIFTDNSATTGWAIYLDSTTLNSQNTHYENNDCVGTIIDGGGNTVIAAPGCPGSAPIALDVSPLTCSGDSAVFEILAGDGDFSITGMGAGLPISPAAAGLYGLVGPDTWMNITITELRGDRQSVNIGGIICPNTGALVATAECVGTDLHINILAGDPSYTVFADSGTLLITVVGGLYIIPGPGTWTNLTVRELMGDMQDLNLGDFDCTTAESAPSATVLGCALDTTDGIEIANAPDNTYCRVLMNNGAVDE